MTDDLANDAEPKQPGPPIAATAPTTEADAAQPEDAPQPEGSVDPLEPQKPHKARKKRSRLKRIGIWSLAVILVLVVLAGLTGVWSVTRAFPQYDGDLKLPGLAGTVKVLRDNHAIPQIYANTTDDLFIAQGYVASQERFFQMDFDRHVTSGTLSEMFGSGQVSTDEYLRTMGWRDVAEQEWNIISPTSRTYLTDFAKGVNDYLSTHSKGAISLEYSVLDLQNSGYKIAPWTPIDSLAWLKALAWDLRGNMDDEIARATLLASGLSRTQIESVYPAYPYGENTPIVANGGSVTNGVFTAGTPASADITPAGDEMTIPKAALPALQAVQAAVDSMPSVVGPSLPGIGSNSWVVSGRLTTTGKPILANDPHLAPSMPSIWFQVGLHCTCGFNVEGYSFADVPGVIIGHNAQIAWGFTNLNPDVIDLYLEKVRGNDYEVDGVWMPLSIRKTTINVAGGKPITLTIRTTNNGPLLSDASDDLKKIARKPDVDASGNPTGTASTPEAGVTYAVALKWTALTPGATMDALFALDAAGNWDQFRAAANQFVVPAQNIVYADVEGNIGYQSPGEIPIRGKGDGRWPAPGWDSSYDWKGFIPFEALPSEENPPDGYFATANQPVISPDTYKPFLTRDWDAYGYRSQRIANMIQAATSGGQKISVADVARMQFDTRNDFAAQIVPAMLTEHVTGATAKAQALLDGWDFQQPAGGKAGTTEATSSAAAMYFNQFWHDLVGLTFDELPAADRPDGSDRWFVVFDNLFQDPTNAWWDNKSTTKVETRDDIVIEAMNDASAQLAKSQGSDPTSWRWGKVNKLTIENQSLGTSGIGPIEWLFNFGPVGVPGGCDMVVATCSDLSQSFGFVDGVPSMRMIVDLSNLDDSRWVQLVGESGHAFSSHYHDQFNLWLTGQTLPMRWDGATIKGATKDTLTLTP